MTQTDIGRLLTSNNIYVGWGSPEAVAGTDADPYDPNRGFLYRYIGWFLMHKTPKMIEAATERWNHA